MSSRSSSVVAQPKHDQCRSCGAPVDWRRTAAGKWCPYDAGTEVSHFTTCPQARQWSKQMPRGGTGATR